MNPLTRPKTKGGTENEDFSPVIHLLAASLALAASFNPSQSLPAQFVFGQAVLLLGLWLHGFLSRGMEKRRSPAGRVFPLATGREANAASAFLMSKRSKSFKRNSRNALAFSNKEQAALALAEVQMPRA